MASSAWPAQHGQLSMASSRPRGLKLPSVGSPTDHPPATAAQTYYSQISRPKPAYTDPAPRPPPTSGHFPCRSATA
eukprot:5591619-Pyramimonas_sp.AAC.1